LAPSPNTSLSDWPDLLLTRKEAVKKGKGGKIFYGGYIKQTCSKKSCAWYEVQAKTGVRRFSFFIVYLQYSACTGSVRLLKIV
jgi:hypothetical protein